MVSCFVSVFRRFLFYQHPENEGENEELEQKRSKNNSAVYNYIIISITHPEVFKPRRSHWPKRLTILEYSHE